MEYNFLKVTIPQEGICILAVSVPKSLNSLSSKVLAEMEHFLANIPDGTHVLIVTGDGDRSFVAGADIAEMSQFNKEQALAFARLGAKIFRTIETFPMPVIAAVNGYALGGGCELAMACDIRIASEKARFGQPEVKLGIIPGFSGTYRLTKLVGEGMAKELIYTARNIKADEALRIGLVNQVVAPENLMPTAIDMAKSILKNAPLAVGFAKKSINGGYGLSSEDFIALENEYFSDCFATEDQKEGMTAFLENREAKFENK